MNEEDFGTERRPGKNTLRCFLRNLPWITVGNTLLAIGLPLAFFMYLIVIAPFLFSKHDYEYIAIRQNKSANINHNASNIVDFVLDYESELILKQSITKNQDLLVQKIESNASNIGEYFGEDINGQNNHTSIPIFAVGKSSLIDSFWIHTSVLISGSPAEGAQVSAIAWDRYGNGFAAHSA